MNLSAALESFLEERQNLKLSQTNKILKMLRDAYSEGLPGLMARPQMDHLTQTGAFEFQIGTPDPEMRIIASWLLSRDGKSPKSPQKVTQEVMEKRWKGR